MLTSYGIRMKGSADVGKKKNRKNGKKIRLNCMSVLVLLVIILTVYSLRCRSTWLNHQQ